MYKTIIINITNTIGNQIGNSNTIGDQLTIFITLINIKINEIITYQRQNIGIVNIGSFSLLFIISILLQFYPLSNRMGSFQPLPYHLSIDECY